MIKALLVGIVLSGIVASSAQAASSISAARAVVSADAKAILDARKGYNAALASRDSAAIAKYWQRDKCESIWANGVLTVGRDNIVARYAKAFDNRDFIWGIRTPHRVDVATDGRSYAAEVGTWKWKMRSSGHVVTYEGRYLAMWHRVDETWRLQSDLYVETACTGGGAC